MPSYSQKSTDHPLKQFFIQRGIKQVDIARYMKKKHSWLSRKLNGYGKPMTPEQEARLKAYADKVKDTPFINRYPRHKLYEIVKKNNIDDLELAEWLNLSLSHVQNILKGYTPMSRTIEISIYLYVMSVDKSVEFPFNLPGEIEFVRKDI